MSDLSLKERKLFEKLFTMQHGFFMNMNSSEMRLFFSDYGIEINNKPFNEYGSLMSDKVRAFWKFASNECVAKVHRDLLSILNMDTSPCYKIDPSDIQKAEEILSRLETELQNSDPILKIETPQKQKTPHAPLKESVLFIADDLWKNNPNLSQSDIMRKNVFKEKLSKLCETLGIQIKDETIRKWLREIDPRSQENKPGPNKQATPILK